MIDSPILLAAGGTGGHLFPAEALAHALAARGLAVELVTEERALRYGGAFPARAMHVIPAGTPRGGSLLAKAQAVARLALGTAQAAALLRQIKPAAVIGFGGYPTVPPLLAASYLGVPSALHEANGVMGKANRFLAGRVEGGEGEVGRQELVLLCDHHQERRRRDQVRMGAWPVGQQLLDRGDGGRLRLRGLKIDPN